MLSMRIVTAGAVILLFSGVAAASAAAQTATTEAPGKPMLLLQIVEQPNEPRTKSHAQTAARKHRKKHHYARVEGKRRHLPVQTAAAPPPDNVSAIANPPAPTAVAAAEPAPPLAPAPTEPTPGELVVGGHVVQIASPGAANDIDRAANNPDPQVNTPAANNAAASAPATSDIAEPMPKSDSTNAASAQPQRSPVGSTSWILQVLAALGGAVAAGSIAWFMIGSAPQRTYG